MLQPKIGFATANLMATFFFKGPNKRWSESHFLLQTATVATLGANFKAGLKLAEALSIDRQNILADDCNLIRTVVSCPALRRNTLESTFASTIVKPGFGDVNHDNDCIPMQLHAGAGYQTKVFLGGIPDDVLVSDHTDFDKQTKWYKWATTYASSLIGGGWGWMPVVHVPASDPVVEVIEISNTDGALDLIFVKCADAHKVTLPGTLVRLSGVDGASKGMPVNQLVYVNPVNDFRLQLLGMPPQRSQVTLVGGTVHKMGRVFKEYGSYSFEEPTTRKRGTREQEAPARKKFKRTIGY